MSDMENDDCAQCASPDTCEIHCSECGSAKCMQDNPDQCPSAFEAGVRHD